MRSLSKRILEINHRLWVLRSEPGPISDDTAKIEKRLQEELNRLTAEADRRRKR